MELRFPMEKELMKTTIMFPAKKEFFCESVFQSKTVATNNYENGMQLSLPNHIYIYTDSMRKANVNKNNSNHFNISSSRTREYFGLYSSSSFHKQELLQSLAQIRKMVIDVESSLFGFSSKFANVLHFLKIDVKDSPGKSYLDAIDEQIYKLEKLCEICCESLDTWILKLDEATVTISTPYFNRKDLKNTTIREKYNLSKVHVRLYCETWHSVIILVTLMVLCGQVSECHPRSCPQSLCTLSTVNRCPTNRIDWIKAAQKKKCIKFEQNCSSVSNFQYHCLLDSTGTGLVEVCAPVHKIIGHYCAEYNCIAMVIQSKSTASCEDFAVPCDFRYASNTSFKYQACYDKVTSATMHHVTSDECNILNATGKPNSTVHIDDTAGSFAYMRTLGIIGGSTILVVASIVIFCLLCVFLRRKTDHSHDVEMPLDITEDR